MVNEEMYSKEVREFWKKNDETSFEVVRDIVSDLDFYVDEEQKEYDRFSADM